MKLSNKTMLVLAGVIAVSVALNYTILRTQVLPSFVELERSKAEQNLKRAQEALGADLRAIGTVVADWANWDDTYEFAADRNAEYIEENLNYLAHENLSLNMMYLFDTAGNLLSGTLFDLDSGEAVTPENFLLDQIGADHPLLQHPDSENLHSGIILTTLGPILLASRPILTNEATGPRRGSFLMGKILSEDVLNGLREQTEVDFRIWPLGATGLPSSEQNAADALLADPDAVVDSGGTESLSLYTLINDPMGNPSLLVRVDTRKEITAIGQETIELALLFMVVVGLIVMAAMWFLLKGVVIGPLSSLTQQVLEIGKSKERTGRLSSSRNDEIGTLAQEFDRMLDELLQKEGMAMLGQITATVSHELRNPLGAMRNSIFAVVESTRNKGLGVERALERVDRNIQRCDDIIGDLMDFAEQKEPDLTTVAIDTWLDKTLAGQALPEGITITGELGAANAEAVIDTGLLRCVIDNLIENAAQAMSDGVNSEDEAAAGKITVTSRSDGDRIEIRISDEGPGIPADVLPKVFEPLFSTKGFGVGVGLPTVRRIMDQFGGEVGITSEPGAGTRVELWLPRQQVRQVAA